MKCVNVNAVFSTNLHQHCKTDPLYLCGAGRAVRGGKGPGPPSLQRRGVCSLKQQNSSADTHRRSLRCSIEQSTSISLCYNNVPIFVV